MLLKVMLILGLILLGTWLAWIYPGQDRNSEDDEWEDAPPQRYMDEPAPAPKVRLPRSRAVDVGRADQHAASFPSTLSSFAIRLLRKVDDSH